MGAKGFSDQEEVLSDADLGMHYRDLPFEKGEYEALDDMMQRFAQTFGCSEKHDDGSFSYYSWREFIEEDRNAVLTPQGE